MKNELIALKQLSKSGEYWGLWAGIDLKSCDPGFIRSADKVKEFVAKLCDKIKMKRFGECVVVDFGDDPKVSGFSMTQLIETSLISGHFVNQTNNVFLDVFSCSYYNPAEVAEFAKEFFKAKEYKLHYKIRK
ncbi:S-adenosylmethionine decarboxylase [Candidatus Pacearchaeota archaeon]|nr:S-adenosylmethionine decarboxylase [Candidatus Pacearchaeota archaeon]